MPKLPPWWTHYAVGAKTREKAVEQLFDLYDRRHGFRRKPAREAFEVRPSPPVPPPSWFRGLADVLAAARGRA